MKVCIPTAGNEGLEATVYNHFGSAPFFVIADSESQDVEILENQNLHHEHGQCSPTHLLDSHTIKAVLCQGMGKRAVMKLQEAGITVYLTGTNTAGQALKDFAENKLLTLDASSACSGHH